MKYHAYTAGALCAAVSALENDLTVMKGLAFRPMTNADDSCMPNYAHHSAPRLVNRPFRRSAWSRQCGGQGFESPWLHFRAPWCPYSNPFGWACVGKSAGLSCRW